MPNWRPLLAGGVVLITGFGAMHAFWALGDWPAELRGLWDYRSATVGDGLLLPVSAGILAGAASRLPRAPGDRRAALVAAALAAVAGIASQWLWLRDPSPELNWTLPEPHAFNAAGWYHAVFLVAATAFLAGAGMMALWRARALRRSRGAGAASRYLEHPWAGVLLACLLGFVGLLMLDSEDIVSTEATRSTLALVLVGAALSLALIRWGFGPITAPGFRNLATALLFAIALGGITREWPPAFDLSSINAVVTGMLLVAIATQLLAWESPSWPLETVTCGLWLLVGFDTLDRFEIEQWADVWLVVIPLAVMLVPIGLIMLVFAEPDEQMPDGRLLFFALPVPLLVTLVADVLASHRNLPMSSQIVDYAFTVFVIYWLVWIGGQRYRLLPLMEVREEPGRRLELSLIATWTAITGIFGGTLAGFVYTIEVAEPGLGWDSPGRTVSPYPGATLTVAVVACLIGAFAWLIGSPEPTDSRIRPNRSGADEPFLPPTLRASDRSLLAAMLAVVAWLALPLVLFAVQRGSGASVFPLAPGVIGWAALLAAAVLSVWIAGICHLSLKGNVGEIEFFRLGARERLLVWLTSAAVGTTTFWLLTAGIWRDRGLVRIMDIMVLSAIVILANTLLATAVAAALYRSAPATGATPRYVSLHHPATNVGHDHLLHGYLLLLGIGGIFLAYRLSQTQIGGWAAAALAVLPLTLTYLEQTMVTEKNYAQHIRSERRRGAESGSLAARLCDPSTLRETNAYRCDLIALRARRVYHFVFYVNPFLFALSLLGRGFGRLKRWVVGDVRILPDAGTLSERPVYLAIVESRGDVRLPSDIMRALGVEPGDIVSFTSNGDGEVRVDTIDYRTAYRVFGEEAEARRRQARWAPRAESEAVAD
jgi:hypothetical protein